MKSVAGTLKLDLAQYRELAAFSQFASDLDEDTRKQLDRGARMVQLLKQDVYSPVVVEKQVCSIYAGAQGYMDEIAEDRVGEFEQALYAALDADGTVLAAIKESGKLEDDTKK